MRSLLKLTLFLLLLIFVAACASSTPLVLQTAVVPVYQASLSVHATQAPVVSSTVAAGTPTPVPSATPTPRVHEIALGDTLLTIAWRYGINLEDLQTANPEIDPNILIVGEQIIIPYQAPTEAVENPTPTPLALTLSQPNCIASDNGGLWCLLSVMHPERGSENVAAEVRLNGAGSGDNLTRLAVAPLNHAVAGEIMPLAVYFTPQELEEAPFTAPYQAQAVLLQALPLNNTEGRYLPIFIESQTTTLNPDGLGAELSGILTLDAMSPSLANRVWLVAALYGNADQLLGFRRWESLAPLNPGDSIAFFLNVYCLDESPIKNVAFLIEAVP